MRTLIASILLLTATQGWSQNLLKNPSFESGKPYPWVIHSKLPAEIFVENNELTVLINQASDDTPSARMLVQKDLLLESNTRYILCFEAKSASSNSNKIKVSIVPTVNFKAGHYGLMRDEQLTEEWSPYQFQFQTAEIVPDDPACLKVHLGGLNGNASFKNFSLEKSDSK